MDTVSSVAPLVTAKMEVKMRDRVNAELSLLPIYADGLQLEEIDTILQSNGFNGLEAAIYCGADGASHEQVGPRTYFKMTWHKMESGRYELVAYVS